MTSVCELRADVIVADRRICLPHRPTRTASSRFGFTTSGRRGTWTMESEMSSVPKNVPPQTTPVILPLYVKLNLVRPHFLFTLESCTDLSNKLLTAYCTVVNLTWWRGFVGCAAKHKGDKQPRITNFSPRKANTYIYIPTTICVMLNFYHSFA